MRPPVCHHPDPAYDRRWFGWRWFGRHLFDRRWFGRRGSPRSRHWGCMAGQDWPRMRGLRQHRLPSPATTLPTTTETTLATTTETTLALCHLPAGPPAELLTSAHPAARPPGRASECPLVAPVNIRQRNDQEDRSRKNLGREAVAASVDDTRKRQESCPATRKG